MLVVLDRAKLLCNHHRVQHVRLYVVPQLQHPHSGPGLPLGAPVPRRQLCWSCAMNNHAEQWHRAGGAPQH